MNVGKAGDKEMAPSGADALLRVTGTFHLLPTAGTALDPERNQLEGDRGQALACAPQGDWPLCPLWSDSRKTNTFPCCYAIREVPGDPRSTMPTKVKVKRIAMTCCSLRMEQGKQHILPCCRPLSAASGQFQSGVIPSSPRPEWWN